MAGNTPNKYWSSMHHLVFECMIHLKYNVNMLSLAEFVEANKRYKNTSVVAKAGESHLRVNVDEVAVTTWEAFKPTD